jgi:hypothetical protein
MAARRRGIGEPDVRHLASARRCPGWLGSDRASLCVRRPARAPNPRAREPRVTARAAATTVHRPGSVRLAIRTTGQPETGDAAGGYAVGGAGRETRRQRGRAIPSSIMRKRADTPTHDEPLRGGSQRRPAGCGHGRGTLRDPSAARCWPLAYARTWVASTVARWLARQHRTCEAVPGTAPRDRRELRRSGSPNGEPR